MLNNGVEWKNYRNEVIEFINTMTLCDYYNMIPSQVRELDIDDYELMIAWISSKNSEKDSQKPIPILPKRLI